jgi:SAM-dependent methyltransferase
LLRDQEIARLNIKNLGYELARSLAQTRLPPRPEAPPAEQLGWRPSTQRDIESEWCGFWSHQLGIKPLYHRKIWELCFILQNMHAFGLLAPEKIGLGFGCGVEPIPSFLASKGVKVIATDLPPDHESSHGWTSTQQHGSTLEKIWHPHLVDRNSFLTQVELRHIDMTKIPNDLRDFDFCWSTCALEHLGSISKGLEFIENALQTLKPGGVAIHTTEFNVGDGATIDNWPTVLFQRHHFEALAAKLTAAGHHIQSVSFDTGSEILDRFVDLPPYHDLPSGMSSINEYPAHMKLSIDGFTTTCFGIVIQRA